MYRAENETVSHVVSECKFLAQKEYKERDNNVCRYILSKPSKNMTLKEHHNGTSMSQIELLRPKGTRFCGILQSSVIILLLSDIVITDKTKEVKIVDVTIPGDVRVNEREVGRTGK